MDELNIELTQQLQSIEHQLQHTQVHMQSLASQVVEIDSALDALADEPKSYQAIGTILVEKPAADIKKDLTLKKEDLEKRKEMFQKQIDILQTKKAEMQQQIIGGNNE